MRSGVWAEVFIMKQSVLNIIMNDLFASKFYIVFEYRVKGDRAVWYKVVDNAKVEIARVIGLKDVDMQFYNDNIRGHLELTDTMNPDREKQVQVPPQL